MIDKEKNLEEIYDYVEKNPRKKLWQTLSQRAMDNKDFDNAQKSMLQTNDFNHMNLANI